MPKFDKYAGLFAEQGDFDIPANWTAGIAVLATPDLTFALDVQQILYSGVKSINNPFRPADLQTGKLLGTADGPGFGWEDMTVVKFGVQYEGGNGWAWRGGYSYGKQPIPTSEVLFNILAPGVVEHHITLGASKAISPSNEISLALMTALSKSVTGPNPLEEPGQQTIEIEMNQWELEVGFSF
jgi:long-chain fatty acid transport protein